MKRLLPIANSRERFIEIKEIEAGVILRYARKYNTKWHYGRSWFVPKYIWEVLKIEVKTDETDN